MDKGCSLDYPLSRQKRQFLFANRLAGLGTPNTNDFAWRYSLLDRPPLTYKQIRSQECQSTKESTYMADYMYEYTWCVSSVQSVCSCILYITKLFCWVLH